MLSENMLAQLVWNVGVNHGVTGSNPAPTVFKGFNHFFLILPFYFYLILIPYKIYKISKNSTKIKLTFWSNFILPEKLFYKNNIRIIYKLTFQAKNQPFKCLKIPKIHEKFWKNYTKFLTYIFHYRKSLVKKFVLFHYKT